MDAPLDVTHLKEFVEGDSPEERPLQPAPLVERYGPFAFKNRYNQLSSISQAFWAGLFADEHIVLHEPAEKQFYVYDNASGLYMPVTEASIKTAVADRI